MGKWRVLKIEGGRLIEMGVERGGGGGGGVGGRGQIAPT